MKNTMKKLLALALVICSLFSFASCSILAPKPAKDLEDAKEALEEADYIVTYYENEDDDSSVVEYLTARNGDDRIHVTKYATLRAAQLAYKALKLERNYEIKELKLQIKSLKYEMRKFADSDTEDMYEEYLDELKEELADLKSEYVIGISGKTVWYGTKDAIKDTK